MIACRMKSCDVEVLSSVRSDSLQLARVVPSYRAYSRVYVGVFVCVGAADAPVVISMKIGSTSDAADRR